MKYTMVIQVLTELELNITMIGEAIAKTSFWFKLCLYLDIVWSKLCPKYLHWNKCSKCLVYIIELQVVAEFQLKTRKNLHKPDFLYFLIISYKFGAYIKRFWYTLLTNWHYL